MKIWIENKIGYIAGYHKMEQPNTIELEVKRCHLQSLGGLFITDPCSFSVCKSRSFCSYTEVTVDTQRS